MRRIAGIVLAVLLIGGAVAAAVAGRHGDDKGTATKTVRGVIGSEKADFFATPDVVKALAAQGCTVQVESSGSWAMEGLGLKGYDFAFPSGQAPADAPAAKCHAQEPLPRPFCSPLVVVAHRSTADVLAANGLAVLDGRGGAVRRGRADRPAGAARAAGLPGPAGATGVRPGRLREADGLSGRCRPAVRGRRTARRPHRAAGRAAGAGLGRRGPGPGRGGGGRLRPHPLVDPADPGHRAAERHLERRLGALHEEAERPASALRDTEGRRQEAHPRHLEDRGNRHGCPARRCAGHPGSSHGRS
ncbi:hypothetical protein ACFC8N_29965 [Streptomyces sp. NPDC055966]|uniref:hypothetical protein n=1 Tax=Streptomyces sp. NPDC055966 TaxID=3345669 RepID=UPI0035DF00B5